MMNVGDYLRIVTSINDGLRSLAFSGANFEPGSANWQALKQCYMKMNETIPILERLLFPAGGTMESRILQIKSGITVSLADTPSEDKETGPGLERPSK